MSRVPEESWTDPVELTTRLPPPRVAVPVEPGLATKVPALSKMVFTLEP